jgi:hypothetical protein
MSDADLWREQHDGDIEQFEQRAVSTRERTPLLGRKPVEQRRGQRHGIDRVQWINRIDGFDRIDTQRAERDDRGGRSERHVIERDHGKRHGQHRGRGALSRDRPRQRRTAEARESSSRNSGSPRLRQSLRHERPRHEQFRHLRYREHKARRRYLVEWRHVRNRKHRGILGLDRYEHGSGDGGSRRGGPRHDRRKWHEQQRRDRRPPEAPWVFDPDDLVHVYAVGLASVAQNGDRRDAVAGRPRGSVAPEIIGPQLDTFSRWREWMSLEIRVALARRRLVTAPMAVL